jgi:hypothetical protein
MIYKSESGIKKLYTHAKHLNITDKADKNITNNNKEQNSPNILEKKKQRKSQKNKN